MGVNLKDDHHLDAATELIYTDLAQAAIDGEGELYRVTEVETNNQQFFTWLQMLDMNVAIILVLMFIVSGFTLIAALLMIVLERISMVGLLKTLGASGGSVRRIFIYLTYKLIFKAIVIGNVLGLGLALIQQHFHVLKLDPEVVDLNDGLFELLFIRMPNSLDELLRITNALSRKNYDCDMIDFVSSSKVTINCEEPLDWTLDGELCRCGKTVTIENIHDAIQVITPEVLVNL